MHAAYQRYLRSADWQQKRRRKLNRSQGRKRRCAICGASGPLDVHHLRYVKDWTKTQQKDLRVLCRACHSMAHALMRFGTLTFASRKHTHRFTATVQAVSEARHDGWAISDEEARRVLDRLS